MLYMRVHVYMCVYVCIGVFARLRVCVTMCVCVHVCARVILPVPPPCPSVAHYPYAPSPCATFSPSPAENPSDFLAVNVPTPPSLRVKRGYKKD